MTARSPRPARLVALLAAGLVGLAALASQACSTLGTLGRLGGDDAYDRPPAPTRPRDPAGAKLYDAARRMRGRRIIISLQDRWLWLVEGSDTLFDAPVAVGKGETFTYRGKRFRFETPRGQRRVLAKETDPVWVPPDWHYYEKAVEDGLEAVHLSPGQRVRLSDGTSIVVRGKSVGRVNRQGRWWPFTPGKEIIFDGKIFIPPFGAPQREVPDALGTHKLDLGDGYLIHGTDEADAIGRPVSHGCVRMRNSDVARLFRAIEPGTPVVIF
jgi:hypothetical protein